ncbi:hypothetical protein [Methylobacterium sp. D48H]
MARRQDGVPRLPDRADAGERAVPRRDTKHEIARAGGPGGQRFDYKSERVVDILQFISAIVGSLAWPLVVIYLLYLLRHQLSALAKRLQEISLPGGGGAKFRDEVREAQIKLDTIVEKEEGATVLIAPKPRIDTPRDKIRDRYTELENQMSLMIAQLPLEKRKIPADIIFHDLKRFESSYPLYKVYSTIRDLSHMAHFADEKALSDNDAEEFDELCTTFLAAFRLQLNELKSSQLKEPEAR